MGRMTPEEAFTKVNSKIGHFRIFGCLVYSHVPKKKRTKLGHTTEKGIFVGYSEVSNAYRIYIPSLRKVVMMTRRRSSSSRRLLPLPLGRSLDGFFRP